jgi:DNA invertase Pin-like site-specific DNA recombinase
VSTRKQGASGLGLEAQRDAISRFAKAEHYQILGLR